MNAYAREVIALFKSRPNLLAIWADLTSDGNPKTLMFLREHFVRMIARFEQLMQQELGLSDPMITTRACTRLYAHRFSRYAQGFIHTHVRGDEDTPTYSVTDGLPTSRYGTNHHLQPSATILQTWLHNSGRPVQAREDSQELSAGSGATITGAAAYNPYYGQTNGARTDGIVFCDQSHLGTSQHVSQLLDGSAIVALNRETGYTNDAMGNYTPASDARLLSRRIFRSNEQGVENGIPVYEQRLYRRNLDRDIGEALRGGEHGVGSERDCAVRGYDMQSLYDRVEHKQRARHAFEATCDERPRMNLNAHGGAAVSDVIAPQPVYKC